MATKLSGQLRSAMSKARKEALEEHIVKSSSHLPIEAIVLPPSQPRRYFDDEAMAQLTASVRQHGVLQPLLVRPHNGSYELVAGERRYRAAKGADLETVPVVVRELSDREATELALIENLQREDLNPVEETEGVLSLLAMQLEKSHDEVVSILYRMHNEIRGKVTHNVMGNSAETVSTAFEKLGGMSWESFVQNRLPLLKLPKDVLAAVRGGRLAYTKALVIARVKDSAEREDLLERAIEKNLSLAQLRERIKVTQRSKPGAPHRELAARLSLVASQLNNNIPRDTKTLERVQQLLQELENLLTSA